MSREVLDGWCERGILALVLAILVFGPLAFGAVGSTAFLVIQGLTVGVLALWGARLWLTPRPQVLWPPICWAVVGFTLYALGRYFTSDIEYVARQELLHVVVYACLFLAIVNNLHRQEPTQLISLTLVFLAMGIAFYALYQFVTHSDRVWNMVTPYKHRGVGTYICPNSLAGLLEMLLPLGLAYTLTGRLKPLTRILLGYATLVLLGGILVTVSRGSWLASTVALVLLFGALLFQRQHRLPALVLLTVVILGSVLLVPKDFVFQSRLKNLVSQEGKTDDDKRFSLWQPALRIWQDNPWWGGGPAHFDYRFRAYRPWQTQVRPELAHNDYLNTLADYGAVGLALVAAALGLLALGTARSWGAVQRPSNTLGRDRGSNKFAFVLGASLGLAALLLHSALDFNLHIPANAIVAITLMALLSAHVRFATERYWVGLRLWAKLPATLLLLAGAFCLGQQAWRSHAEAAWLNQAAHASPFSDEQIKALQQAFAVEPKNAETASRIGEALRTQSLDGGENSRDLATQALAWFERSTQLNPLESQGFLRQGLCLDWLGRSSESGPSFDRAEQLDPNGYFTVANIGLHYVSLGDYAAARPWFQRSLHLSGSEDNPIARSYLELANNRLMDTATNELRARLYSQPNR